MKNPMFARMVAANCQGSTSPPAREDIIAVTVAMPAMPKTAIQPKRSIRSRPYPVPASHQPNASITERGRKGLFPQRDQNPP